MLFETRRSIQNDSTPHGSRTISRREFSSAVLGTTAALAYGDASGVIADDKADKRSMTLGFSSYGMKTLKTDQAIDAIAMIGFDAVELTVWPGWDAAPESMSKERRRAIRTRLVDKGLVLTSLMEHIYPTENKAEQLKHLDRLKRVYELANDLSPNRPPVVQTVLGGGQWEKKKQLFVDRVGSWAELGEQSKIVTCVKPHRGGGMSQPAEFLWLIKQLKETRWVRMVYDYSHYIFRDIPFVESIMQSLPYTAHVAVKDTINENGKMKFVLPGEAKTIDFLTLIKMLKAGGYTGDISCEVSGMVWGKPGYQPIKAAQTCYNNLAPIFKEAGLR
jgi:sugar phosphate isomerase/epimerase